MAIYKCTNYLNCTKADNSESVELDDSIFEPKCECGMTLVAAGGQSGGRKTKVLVSAVALIVLVLLGTALIVWRPWQNGGKETQSNSLAFTNPDIARALLGQPFRFELTLNAEASKVTAEPLPPGFRLDNRSLLASSPVNSGEFTVILSAQGPKGAAKQTLKLIVSAETAKGFAFTSADTVKVPVGEKLSFSLKTTRPEAKFALAGSPAWAKLAPDGVTVTGTPDRVGNFDVTVTATAGELQTRQTLKIQIVPPGSALSVAAGQEIRGKVGDSLPDFTVEATGSPSEYSAVGLPLGLSIDSRTGRIAGTPMQSVDTFVNVRVTRDSDYAVGRIRVAILDGPGGGDVLGIIELLQRLENSLDATASIPIEVEMWSNMLAEEKRRQTPNEGFLDSCQKSIKIREGRLEQAKRQVVDDFDNLRRRDIRSVDEGLKVFSERNNGKIRPFSSAFIRKYYRDIDTLEKLNERIAEVRSWPRP